MLPSFLDAESELTNDVCELNDELNEELNEELHDEVLTHLC